MTRIREEELQILTRFVVPLQRFFCDSVTTILTFMIIIIIIMPKKYPHDLLLV